MDIIVSISVVSIILSIIYGLHKLTNQQIQNIQNYIENEFIKIQTGADKVENRLDVAAKTTEDRLQSETTRSGLRLESLLKSLENQTKLYIDGITNKIDSEFQWMKETHKIELLGHQQRIVKIEDIATAANIQISNLNTKIIERERESGKKK